MAMTVSSIRMTTINVGGVIGSRRIECADGPARTSWKLSACELILRIRKFRRLGRGCCDDRQAHPGVEWHHA